MFFFNTSGIINITVIAVSAFWLSLSLLLLLIIDNVIINIFVIIVHAFWISLLLLLLLLLVTLLILRVLQLVLLLVSLFSLVVRSGGGLSVII